MNLDVETLGTLYEMASEGAGLAADRLSGMVGVGTRVRVTRLNFTRHEAIRAELEEGAERLGIRVRFEGGLEGTSVLLFERSAAERIARWLVAEPREEEEVPEELARSAVAEAGQIMSSGFIDGWADALGTEIEITTPELFTGDSVEDLLDGTSVTPDGGDLALLFRSNVMALGGEEIKFQHYLFPDHDSIATLLDRGGADEGIEYEKLAGFDLMADRAADTVADHLTRMTGVESTVDIRRINFISLAAIPRDVPNAPMTSVAFRFQGAVSGYLLFLFDRVSVEELVEATVGADADRTLGRDAIQELGNVMASGLLDGWANMLESTIDHSPPVFARDMGSAVVDPLVVGLADQQEFAFVFDTEVTAVDAEIDVDIYVIPDEPNLREALEIVDADRAETATTSADVVGDIPEGGDWA